MTIGDIGSIATAVAVLIAAWQVHQNNKLHCADISLEHPDNVKLIERVECEIDELREAGKFAFTDKFTRDEPETLYVWFCEEKHFEVETLPFIKEARITIRW